MISDAPTGAERVEPQETAVASQEANPQIENEIAGIHSKLDHLLLKVDLGFAALQAQSHDAYSPKLRVPDSNQQPHLDFSSSPQRRPRLGSGQATGRPLPTASPKLFERRRPSVATEASVLTGPFQNELQVPLPSAPSNPACGGACDTFPGIDSSTEMSGALSSGKDGGKDSDHTLEGGHDSEHERNCGSADNGNLHRDLSDGTTNSQSLRVPEESPASKQKSTTAARPARPHLPGFQRGFSSLSKMSEKIGFTRVVPEVTSGPTPPRGQQLRAFSEATLSPIQSQPPQEVGTFAKLRQKTTRHGMQDGGTRLSQLKWTLPGQNDKPLAALMHRFLDAIGLSHLIAQKNELLRIAEKKRLWNAVHGWFWNGVVGVMILASTAIIGVSADDALHAELDHKSVGDGWAYVELMFSCFFLLELLVRLAAEQCLFFIGPLWRWNLFDTILVSLSILDLAMNGVSSDGGSNVTSARILRITRSVRILRLVRTARDFQSLRVVVLAIIGSMLSLVWTFLVVGFIIYIFAVFFLLAVHDHVLSSDNIDSASDRNLLDFYGGLYKCIVTLFATISGGIDWYDALRPLRSLSWVYELVFMTYIFFMFFGVLNVVIGAFVAATAEAGTKDREAVISSQMNDLVRYTRKLKGVFMDADSDGSGTLSWEEFKDYLQHPKVKAYFQSFGLKVSEAHILFQLLDRDGSNKISIEEFLEGCWRLKGEARSIDVNMLLYMTEVLFNEMVVNLELMQRQMNQVTKKLGLKDERRKAKPAAGPGPMSRQGTGWFHRFESVANPDDGANGTGSAD